MPSLTTYTGNAGLGSGSNPQIPVSNTGNGLEPLAQAGRDATILNIEGQRQLYQQKVKDHEQLLKLISSGDLQVGDLLDRDRETVKKSLDSLDEAWRKRGQKGFNDIDAAVDYNKALRGAQETITQAQVRKVMDAQVQSDAAKEQDEAVRNDMLAGHDKYLSSFWSDYKPYVRAQTLNHPELQDALLRDALVPNAGIQTGAGATQHRLTKRIGPDGKITVWDTTTNKPATSAQQKAGLSQGSPDGLSMFQKIPGKYYDFNKIQNNADDNFHDFKQLKNMQLFEDYWLRQATPPQVDRNIDFVNKRINDYNEQRGFNKDEDGYVKGIKVGYDENGQRFFTDENGNGLKTSELNARLALANVSGDYVEKDKEVIDPEALKYKMHQETIKAENYRARLAQNGANYRANLPYEKLKLTASENAAKDFGNIIYGVNADKATFVNGFSPVDAKGKPFRIVNGAVVNSDGAVANFGDDVEFKVPAGAIDNTIITEFNKYAGQSKVDKDGNVIATPSSSMIKPDAEGNIIIKVGKDGVIKGVLTTDAGATEANPIPGTFATVDQFQYITTQSSQKGATKYKKPEDISGGVKPPEDEGQYEIPANADKIYDKKSGKLLGYKIGNQYYKF